jgi:hypothetical protein
MGANFKTVVSNINNPGIKSIDIQSISEIHLTVQNIELKPELSLIDLLAMVGFNM